jgi:hypothetical protein
VPGAEPVLGRRSLLVAPTLAYPLRLENFLKRYNAGPQFAKQTDSVTGRMMEMPVAKIRHAHSADSRELAELCAMLWPEGSLEEHRREVDAKIASGQTGTLPVAIFVAEDNLKSSPALWRSDFVPTRTVAAMRSPSGSPKAGMSRSAHF